MRLTFQRNHYLVILIVTIATMASCCFRVANTFVMGGGVTTKRLTATSSAAINQFALYGNNQQQLGRKLTTSTIRNGNNKVASYSTFKVSSIRGGHQSSAASRRTTTTTSLKSVARDALSETSKTGEFKRTESTWRNWISSGTCTQMYFFEYLCMALVVGIWSLFRPSLWSGLTNNCIHLCYFGYFLLRKSSLF